MTVDVVDECAAARINGFWKQGRALHQVCEQWKFLCVGGELVCKCVCLCATVNVRETER